MKNIENLYHNFATTLLSSINKFSIEVSTKTSNSRTNTWYDQECKDARKEIKQATTYLIKFGQDKALQSLNSKEKRNYLSKRKENLLHLSKVAPKKFCRQILTPKTKEDNKIALKKWNSYLKIFMNL